MQTYFLNVEALAASKMQDFRQEAAQERLVKEAKNGKASWLRTRLGRSQKALHWDEANTNIASR